MYLWAKICRSHLMIYEYYEGTLLKNKWKSVSLKWEAECFYVLKEKLRNFFHINSIFANVKVWELPWRVLAPIPFADVLS